MVEMSVTRVGGATIAIIRIDETDPTAVPEVIQPMDAETLTVLLSVLNKFKDNAEATAAAWA